MASSSGEGAPVFSIRNGCKVFTDQAFTVEDVLLAMGEIVGHEKIVSASRMNKAVVVFLKDEKSANSLVENGIVMSDTWVQVTPLRAPATKVTISNVPPFISNGEIVKELSRFGKFAGPVKTVPLGCKNAALKHVLSFRRQVHMFLNAPTKSLDVSFRIHHGVSSYMIFATTDRMRCFECGDLGHKKFACPHKKQSENETNVGNSDVQLHQSETTEIKDKEKRPVVVKDVVIPAKKLKTNGAESVELEVSGSASSVFPQAVSSKDRSVIDQSSEAEVSVFNSSMQAGGNDGSNDLNGVVDANVIEHGSEDVVADVSGLQSSLLIENEDSDEGMLEDCDSYSEISEIECSQSLKDVYSVDEINDFLDVTKGKKVDVLRYFPDARKFVKSVVSAQKSVGYDVISKQKRYRLRKFVTIARKTQKAKGELLKSKKK